MEAAEAEPGQTTTDDGVSVPEAVSVKVEPGVTDGHGAGGGGTPETKQTQSEVEIQSGTPPGTGSQEKKEGGPMLLVVKEEFDLTAPDAVSQECQRKRRLSEKSDDNPEKDAGCKRRRRLSSREHAALAGTEKEATAAERRGRDTSSQTAGVYGARSVEAVAL